MTHSMTSGTNRTTDESVVQELDNAELESAAGGFSLSGVWDDVKSDASAVATEVENHPIATLAIVAGAVTGVDSVVGLAAVVGSDAAAIMGVSTGDLVAGAVARTGAAAFSGGANGAVISGIESVVKKL